MVSKMASSEINKELSESSDSDSDEEEPKLKYERISGGLQDIFRTDGASAIFVNDKLLVVGTNWGRIHVLDHQGNVVKQFHAHNGPIIQLSMDVNGDYIGSCSHSKKIVIQGLYTSDNGYNLDVDSLVRCIALDPHFGGPRSKIRFLIGTHQIVMYEKALFGALKQTVLAEGVRGSGEVIRNMRWHGQFMAWASDSSVRVMDIETRTVISLIKRDHSLALGCDQYPPHIVWRDDRCLLIGWGDSVKICRVRERLPNSGGNGQNLIMDLPPYYVEIVYMFTTDFYICGIGPLDKLVVVLGYNKNFHHSKSHGKNNESEGDENGQNEDGELEEKGREDVSRRQPQMRVLLPLQGSYEELSKDVLAIRCYEEYRPVHYHLDHLSEERCFYIVSPQDIVVAKPREANDRVQWLLEHGRFHEALEVVINCGGKVCEYTTLNVGQTYVDHLIQKKKYKEAADLCPRILGDNQLLWEATVSRFNNLGHLTSLSRHIPTRDPLLPCAIYHKILMDLLKMDQKIFLTTVQEWPKNLYNVNLAIDSVLELLVINTSNVVLLQALAHLYSNIDKHDRALAIYLKLNHKDVFGLIRRHSLYWCISKHIVVLMKLDADATLSMCSGHITAVHSDGLVETLRKFDVLLFKYLGMVYSEHRELSIVYHNDLVSLYALYDRQKLMPLLRVSSSFDLSAALQVVKSHRFNKETVYLLDRMGNTEAALRIVLEEGDIDWAMRICEQHSDPDLWIVLIRHSLDKPEYIRELLNRIGAHVDPLLILQCIPRNMEIPGLRDALTKILHDYQIKISLQEGYQKILVTDGVKLLEKQVLMQASAVSIRKSSECSICNKKLIPNLKSDVKDDFSLAVFLCRHSFHTNCLIDRGIDQKLCIICTNEKKFKS